MGFTTPTTIRINRPISRAGVRIFPTMSTTAVSRTHSSRISRKKRMEKSAGLKPDTSGAREVS
jgi:hypothetical protein